MELDARQPLGEDVGGPEGDQPGTAGVMTTL